MIESFKGRSIGQSFDWKLLSCYLLLVIFGLLNIYASVHGEAGGTFLSFSTRSGKQIVWIVTALVIAALIIFAIPPELWVSGAVIFYIFVVFLLVAVIFLGVEVKGSRSWFEFGPVRFQPAEISKISTSLMLAAVMSRSNFKISKLKDFLLAALIIGVPMLVIVAEDETGSALVYVGFIFMLYREGLTGWILMLIGLTILTFVLTLTASPYAAILTLAMITTFFLALNIRKIGKWILYGLGTGAIMSLLPWLINLLQEEFIPGAALLRDGLDDAWVKATILANSSWHWLLKVKPIYFLLALTLPAAPAALVKSYRKKDYFLGASALAFLVGIFMVYSTDFLFNDVLQDHQRSRIEVLLGMRDDPSGVGYNVNQSMIAIGSGGLSGKGYLNGTQTTYGFVPEQSTDFIFCTVGEEWGFVGCVGVILLYGFMIMRIIIDAEHSREHFTRIYGYCVASCLFMHLFINIGMTIGIMPVIGIPLPLMSYGGSSLWAFTAMIAIFVVLDHEERKYF